MRISYFMKTKTIILCCPDLSPLFFQSCSPLYMPLFCFYLARSLGFVEFSVKETKKHACFILGQYASEEQRVRGVWPTNSTRTETELKCRKLSSSCKKLLGKFIVSFDSCRNHRIERIEFLEKS